MYSQPEENTSGKVFFIFSGDFHRARQFFCLLSDKLFVVYADILDPFFRYCCWEWSAYSGKTIFPSFCSECPVKIFVPAEKWSWFTLWRYKVLSLKKVSCTKAYLSALDQGADIVETDVAVSSDGELFTFHPCMESPLRVCGDPRIAPCQFRQFPSPQFGVQIFDEPLEVLKKKMMCRYQ